MGIGNGHFFHADMVSLQWVLFEGGFSACLRAPAVQMEARGGGEGALGDMSPDTYIIGITVLGIASLFANISGFFNPWEDMRRPESGSGHDIEVFSYIWRIFAQSRSPCDLGRHSVFERNPMLIGWVPGSRRERNPILFICWAWSHVSIAGCEILGWPWLIIPNSKHTWVSVCCSYRVCIHIGLRDDFGFSLTSLKAAPVQLSVWQNLQHGSLRLTCARLRALGPCLLGDALLCGHHSQSCCRKHPVEAVFAGTGRADGGARRRWGCPWRHESRHLHHWHHRAWDCILVCQHQRLLQPMRRHEKTREWQRPWYRGF